MNAQTQAQRAYAHKAAPIRTPQGAEYEVFTRITQALSVAAAKGKSGFPELAAAIHSNRKLWTILAADVSDAANQLPRALKARVFYLSEFTQDYSRKVLSAGAPAAPLIEINTAIMRGLRTGGSGS